MTRVLRGQIRPLPFPGFTLRPPILLAALLTLSAVPAFAQGGLSPVISSINPTNTPVQVANGPGISLTVNTNSFTQTGSPQIFFNGVGISTTTGGTNIWTGNVPAALLTTAQVVPVTMSSGGPSGVFSPAVNFTIGNVAPVISSINPTATAQNGTAFNLIVNTNSFFPAQSPQIFFNGVGVSTTTGGTNIWSGFIPATALQTAGVVPVTMSANGASGPFSPAANFTIVGTPAITGFSPSVRTQGNTTLPLNILGSNFVAGDTVTWDSQTFTPGNILPGDITINLNAAAVTLGLHNVTVHHSLAFGSGTSNTAQINVTPVPVLNSLSQNFSTATGAAFTLGLNGTNFPAGSKIILSDSSTSSITSFTPTTSSATLLTLALPAGFFSTPSNTLSFSAITPDGVQTGSLSYTVNPIPTISTLSPNTIAAGSAQFTLTVSGSGSLSGDTVQWNGADRVTNTLTNGIVIATIPSTDITAPGTANVRVRTFDQVVSNTLTFTITKLSSTGTLAISPASTAYGSPLTLTATFSAVSGNLIPTGTVTFVDGGSLQTLGTATLNGSGVATLITTEVFPGTNVPIFANWPGDNNFNPPAGPVIRTVTVTAATPTVTLSAVPSTVALGAASTVTYSVTVTGGTATRPPGGSVTINDGGLAITSGAGTCSQGGNFTTNGSGNFTTVSCTVIYDGSSADRAVGSHSITATYSPNEGNGTIGFYTSSTSAPANTVTVTAATPTISVPSAAPPAPLVVGQQTAISVTVTGISPVTTFNTLAGFVNFFDGATQLNGSPIALTVNSGNVGTASLPAQAFPLGNHAITARFTGSPNYAAVTSATLNLNVNKAATTTTLSAASASAVFGIGDLLTASVAVNLPATGTPTGTVSLQNSGVAFASGTLTNGTFTYNLTTAIPPGFYNNLTAVYSGDTNDAVSTSAPATVTITKNGTTGTLVVSPSGASPFGQAVTLTATFTAAGGGAGTPSGTVTFIDATGSVTLGTVNLVGGVATLTTSAILPGTRTLAANWPGDADFNPPATAPTATLTVNPAVSTVTLTAGPTSVPMGNGAGSTVTYTVNVSGGPANTPPSGTITIRDGGQLAPVSAGPGTCPGGFTLTPGGGNTASGSCTMIYNGSTADRALPPPIHSMQASYVPSGGSVGIVTGGLSPAIAVNVTAATATLGTPTATPASPLVSGQQTVLSVSVAGLSPQTVFNTLAGNVTFFDGATQLGSAVPLTVNAFNAGTAALPAQAFSVATHSITVQFTPTNGNYGAGTSGTLSLVVGKATTTTSLSPASTTTNFGTGDLLTATVAVTGNGVGTPTGTITIQNNGVTLATGSLTNGSFAYNLTTALLPGFYPNIVAVYSGDANNLGSSSPAVGITVNKIGTTATLTTSPTPSAPFGQSVTLTATFTPAAGSVVPTGTVTFTDTTTGATLGTAALNASGVAILSTTTIGPGANQTLTATWPGDSNFTPPAVAPTAILTVNAAPTNLQLTEDKTSATLGSGAASTITYTATVTGTPNGLQTLGTITILDGGSPVSAGSGTCVPGGNALSNGSAGLSCTVIYDGSTADRATGIHSVSAVYAPSGASVGMLSGSNSPAQTINVSGATPTIGAPVASPASPLFVGQQTTISVTVTGFAPQTAFNALSGTVNFFDGATPLNGAPIALVVNSGNVGTASLPAQAFSLGNHSITAQYSGNSVYAAVTSGALTLTVGKASTTTVFFQGVTNATFGIGDVLSASVLVAGVPNANNFPVPGTPATGTVSFQSNGVTFGTGNVINGEANYTLTTALPPGNYPNITATYSGDSNYLASTSAASSLTVSQNSTTATLVTNPTPASAFGQPVALTATFTPGNGGAFVWTVQGGTFADAGAFSGSFTFNPATLALSSWDLTAGAGSDAAFPAYRYTPATSFGNAQRACSDCFNGFIFTFFRNSGPVQGGNEINLLIKLQLTAPLDPVTGGSASVIAGSAECYNCSPSRALDVFFVITPLVSSPSVKPTGTVTFVDSTGILTTLGTGALNAGVATSTTSSILPGVRTLTANWPGDTNYTAPLAAPTANLTVSAVTPTVTLSPVPSSVPMGNGAASTVTYTATVSGGPANQAPTGLITILDGSTPVSAGTGTCAGGVNLSPSTGNTSIVSCTVVYNGSTADRSTGLHQMSAAYNPTGASAAILVSSASAQQAVNVTGATAIVSTPTAAPVAGSLPLVAGQQAVLSVTVTGLQPATANNALTGSVTFFDGATQLNASPIALTVNASNVGTASLPAQAFAVGTHNIAVQYSGNAPSSPAYAGASSVALVLTVGKVSTATTLTAATSSFVFGNGDLLTATVAVTGNGVATPTGTVSFKNGSITFGTGTLALVSGVPTATYNLTTALPPNTYNITAVYNGDANDNTSTSAATAVTVSAVPTITGISPTTVTAGNTGFTLTVTGTNFASGMTLNGLGAPKTAATVTSTQLTFAIGAADLTTPGTFSLTIVTPDPVISNAVTFTILPTPTLTTLTPSSHTAGFGAFTLTVAGTNFVNGMTVQWNGANRPTTFISATQLNAAIAAADIVSVTTANVTVLTVDGFSTNAATFTVNAAPTISSLSPASHTAGGPAFTLTVNGSNFVSGMTVKWNGQNRPTIFAAGALTASITANDIAISNPAAVTVATADGFVSNSVNFLVTGAPTVSALSPASATAGSAGFTLTVTGTNFTGGTISWNGTPRITTVTSATQATIVLAGADLTTAGSVPVTMVSADGVASNAVNFTIKPAPTVTALNPASRTAGSPGFTITVTGTNFFSDTRVAWNGQPRQTTFVSSTQLTGAITAADVVSVGEPGVSVVTGDGVASNFITFPVNPGAVITALTPSQRTAGAAGFTLTVTGTSFVAGTIVKWNGSARQTTFGSATQLTAAISGADLAQAGPANVTAVTPDGVSSNTFVFNVVGPSVISLLNPASHTAGSPGFTLTVTGTNLTNNTTINWNGSPRPTSLLSAGSATASISAADLLQPGNANVTAVNDGVASNILVFTIAAPPTITSLSVTSRAAGSPGFTLTVNGTGFTSGTTVTWNGSVRTPAIVSATQLTFGVTANDLLQPGVVPITVVSADGVASNAVNFNIAAGQTLTSLSVNSRTAGSAGFSLTVTGTNFTGTMTVDWNGSPRPTSFLSSTQLAASIPASDLTVVNPTIAITVVTADGLVVSNSLNFAVVGAPTITSLRTPLGTSFRTAGSAAFTLTVTGTNFVTGMTASFNGSSRPAVTQSITQLTFAVAASELAQANAAIPVFVRTSDGINSNSVNFAVNPPPTVSSLNPLVRTAGSGSFTLTVTGTNFSTGSIVTFNGAGRQTTVVSATQATATIGQGDVAAATTVPITVVTGDFVASNASTFTVLPAPTVTGISPSVRTAGSPAFTLTVTGTNFTADTTVLFQGASQITTFVSATQLTAAIPASLVATTGSVAVTTSTGDGVVFGSPQLFQIVPPPTLTALSPSAATAGAAGFILTITGTNFVNQGAGATSQAVFGGSQVATAVVSGTQLTASIPASLIATAGPVAVQVLGPGGVGSNSLSFTVNGPLTITGGPATLNFTQGATFVAHNSATGGTPPYTWSVIGLPSGLGINSSSGDISGTPGTTGTLSITVTVTDAAGASASARYGGTGGTGGGAPPLVFTTANLASGTVAVPYIGGVGATGGTGTITFSVTGGNLPDGLGFSSAGVLSGTPTTPGSFGFSVTATDSAGISVGATFSIQINPASLVVTGTNPASAFVGDGFSFTFGATGGVKPYKFSVNGNIPAGTSVSGQTISGTLTDPGNFGWTIAVTDNAGTVASRGFSITVAPVTLAVIGGALPDAQVGVPYSASVQAKGGTKPYKFSGSAPDGLSVNADSSVTGTPATDGQFTVSVTVTDAAGARAVGVYTLNIAPAPLTITTNGLPDGSVNSPYSAGVVAAGGVKPYTFSFGGTPDGVGGNADGSINGTPTSAGSFTISATVRDAAGHTATRSFGITITAAPLVLTLSAGNGTVGVSYSGGATATGGVKPYSFSASGLPAGVSISSTTGAISGTPSAAGTTTLAVTVKDAAGKTATSSTQVTINLPPTPPVNFTGVTPVGTPGTQQTVQVTIGSTYPVDVNVTLTLTFAADSGPDDPTVQFSTGGRTARLTIPAGTTITLTGVGVQTGTVAGLITITSQLSAGTTDITPSPAPTRTIRINPAPPTITSATATRNGTGFTVVVTGFVPDREIVSVTFTFNAAPGSTLQTASLTVPVDAVFGPYFSGPGVAFGSQFTFTQPFNVSGSTQSIVSVTITMVNKLGTSTSVTVNLVG